MTKHFELFEKWLTFGLIAFVTSFIWSPSRDGLEATYGLFFLVPFIFLFFKRNLILFVKKERLILLILVFGFYSTITSLWNKPKDIYFFLLQFLILATWIIGSYWLTSAKKIDIRRILLTLIYLGSLTSLVTVVAFYQGGYQGVYHFEVRLTCWCSAESANLVGALYGILTIISYAFFLSSETNRERIKFCLISAILVLPLIFSQSRGALAAFLITAVIAAFILKPRLWLIMLQFIVALPALGLFIATNYSNLSALWLDRTASIGQRDSIWQYVFSQIFDNFFIGVGISKNTKLFIDGMSAVHHAHNSWIDTFYRTGLIGFLLILTVTVMLLKRAITLKSVEGTALFLWLLFGLVTLTFDHRILFWQIDTKWFFYWIPAPFILALYNQQKLNKL